MALSFVFRAVDAMRAPPPSPEASAERARCPKPVEAAAQMVRVYGLVEAIAFATDQALIRDPAGTLRPGHLERGRLKALRESLPAEPEWRELRRWIAILRELYRHDPHLL